MSTKDDNEGEVPEAETSFGYAKSPRTTRFEKGVSVNPKGRPKGSLNVPREFLRKDSLRPQRIGSESGAGLSIIEHQPHSETRLFRRGLDRATSGDTFGAHLGDRSVENTRLSPAADSTPLLE
jgi:Family of unknown function (DUF5681)